MVVAEVAEVAVKNYKFEKAAHKCGFLKCGFLPIVAA
jgi:hypothetical protein